MKKINCWIRDFVEKRNIKQVIIITFTVTAFVILSLVAFAYYTRYNHQVYELQDVENERALDRVETNLTQSLRDVMNQFDLIYYTIINSDEIDTQEFDFLYSSNKETIKNITLFDQQGNIVQSAPNLNKKEIVDVSSQEWFLDTRYNYTQKNFSNPHVQTLFEESDEQGEWVISLSQSIPLPEGTQYISGVLLIDIHYSALGDFVDTIAFSEQGYAYIINDEGSLIYHPKMQLIESGETTLQILEENHKVYTQSIPYTGWTLVGVVEDHVLSVDTIKNNLYLLTLFFIFFTIMLWCNSVLSSFISRPIVALEHAVESVAQGDMEQEIPSVGYEEVHSLSTSIQKMMMRIRSLMDESIQKQEQLRKNELLVLQSQINPHFLYNTLDIIVWLIEKKDSENASKVVTALGRFFRLSLSKGKNIIFVKDEIEHVRNYLDIQMVRYKDKFEYTIEVDPQVEHLYTMKLILQPIVENALYHAIEYMLDEGEIHISAKLEEDFVVFCIQDNGMGMDEKTRLCLESGQRVDSAKGSGIGVQNVVHRLQMTYGHPYGLYIVSELDEGTCVYIKIPVQKEAIHE